MTELGPLRLDAQIWKAEIRRGQSVTLPIIPRSADGRADAVIASAEVWTTPRGMVPYAALVAEAVPLSTGRLRVLTTTSPEPDSAPEHRLHTRLRLGLSEDFAGPVDEELAGFKGWDGVVSGRWDQINSNNVAFRLAACLLQVALSQPENVEALGRTLVEQADRIGVEDAVRAFRAERDSD